MLCLIAASGQCGHVQLLSVLEQKYASLGAQRRF